MKISLKKFQREIIILVFEIPDSLNLEGSLMDFFSTKWNRIGVGLNR
jgi:hypothetical protein